MNIIIDNESAIRARNERLDGKAGLYKFFTVQGKFDQSMLMTVVCVIVNLFYLR